MSIEELKQLLMQLRRIVRSPWAMSQAVFNTPEEESIISLLTEETVSALQKAEISKILSRYGLYFDEYQYRLVARKASK